jgi:hemin uptake protein HemP
LAERPPAGKPTAPETSRPAPRTLESAEILKGEAEVAIRHNGRLYRLSRTRSGKLILT